ncbi:MAG: NAD(+) kinase [Gammaproteobacteria bacterium]|nr:NAD(+) kinase [Gammaproteobacteria bacterium]
MTTIQINNVGIIGKYNDSTAGELLSRLNRFFVDRKINVLLDAATAKNIPELDIETVDRESLGAQSDIIIVVGGDGTLLNAARTLANYSVPLVGINRGRLGFLTDISPDMLEVCLNDILNGEYKEEERFLLHASILRNGEHISESYAFNDVVMHKWDIARMIEIDTYIDGAFVHTIRADGLIVSTPTGSTAYALSGGGPILQSNLDAVVLVPICPHTMSNRPIVVSANSRIEVVVSSHSQAQVTCDGQINLGLVAEDRVVIQKHPNAVRLLHPATYDYFDILRAKLNWGGRMEDKN